MLRQNLFWSRGGCYRVIHDNINLDYECILLLSQSVFDKYTATIRRTGVERIHRIVIRLCYYYYHYYFKRWTYSVVHLNE